MGIKYRMCGSVIFEPQEKKLSGNGKTVTLSASATYCLELLIERKGQLVKHDDFYDFVWRKYGMEPTAASLYQNISRLRGALKESGIDEDVIRTMARRGFIIPGKILIVLEKNAQENIDFSSAEQDDDIQIKPLEACTSSSEENTYEGINEKRNFQPEREFFFKKLKRLSGFKRELQIIAMVMTLAVVIFLFFCPSPVGYYKYDFSQGECQFYLKTNSHNPEVIEKFSRELSLNCTERRYVYITFYESSDRVSVFTCLKPLSYLRKSYCYSDYFIKDIRE